MDPATVRVHAFTSPRTNRAPTREQIDRERSAALVTRELSSKKRLMLVPTPRDADVVVEVLSAVGVFSPLGTEPFDPDAVPADVNALGHTTRLTVSHSDPVRAANKLADEIDRWIKENRTKILAARPPSK